MAKRDMRQTAAAAKAAGIIPDQYELTAPELSNLFRQTQEGPNQAYSAIETAFIYGFVLGQRATKAKARRARKAAKEERLHAQAAELMDGIRTRTPEQLEELKDHFADRPDLLNIIELAEAAARA
jgi:hypothetical protein